MNGLLKNASLLSVFVAAFCTPGLLGAKTKATNSPSPLVEIKAPAATGAPVSTATATNHPALIARDLPEIHGKISLPKEWTLLPGKLLEGDVLLATREKIGNENDPWSTGLSMMIDRNGAKDSNQKASAYAQGLAEEAREKSGEEATQITQSQSGEFREFRFEFPVAGDQPLLITEVLRANDSTGTVATIVWQMPADEAPKLKGLRDAVLSGITLDPAR